jgi:hypothetical protein
MVAAAELRASSRPDYVIAGFPGWNLGFFRIGGPGLGNLLFIWARAFARSLETGAVLIDPVWHQLKVGPILRRERDLRTYLDVFPVRSPRAVWRELVRCRLLGRPPTGEVRVGGARVTYEIVRDGRTTFHDLDPYREQIRTVLPKLVRPRALPSLPPTEFIALHVRLGDFAPPREGTLGTAINTRLPLSWYLAALRAARAAHGDPTFPALVFSDGADEELEPLLREPGVERAPPRPAFADMLTMARARVLVCSNSTFSFWAAFLGQAMLVAPPGLDLVTYFPSEMLASRIFRCDIGAPGPVIVRT